MAVVVVAAQVESAAAPVVAEAEVVAVAASPEVAAAMVVSPVVAAQAESPAVALADSPVADSDEVDAAGAAAAVGQAEVVAAVA